MIYEPRNGVRDKIARRLRPLQNRRMIEFKLDRPIVSITFDDFPKSAIDIGAAELETRGWTGTYYTSAGLKGISNHHGPHFKASDLPLLESKGHEIAGHTHDHIGCTSITTSEVMQQVTTNVAALRSMGVTGPIDGFAYPFGEANAGLKQTLSEHYHAVRGISDGVHYNRADLNELKSCGLYSSTYESVMRRIHSLGKKPGWITLFTHDIQHTPSQWGCTPAEYKSVLDAIADQNAIVLPVREAVQFLEAHHAN